MRLFLCPHCEDRVPAAAMVDHISKAHPGHEHDFVCDLCEAEGFATKQRLATHRSQAHSIRSGRLRGKPRGKPKEESTVAKVPLIEITEPEFSFLWHVIDTYGERDLIDRVVRARYEQDDGFLSRTVAWWMGYDGDVTKVKWSLDRLEHGDGLIVRETLKPGDDPDKKRTRLYALEVTPLGLNCIQNVPKVIRERIIRQWPIHQPPEKLDVADLAEELRLLRLELKAANQATNIWRTRAEENKAERDRILKSRGQIVHTSETPDVDWELKRLQESAPGGRAE